MRNVFGALMVVFLFTVCYALDYERGARNYQAILAGKKKFEQLSAEERQEVMIIMKAMRSSNRYRGKSSACRDAVQRAESAADDLEAYSGRLRSCAANRD